MAQPFVPCSDADLPEVCGAGRKGWEVEDLGVVAFCGLTLDTFVENLVCFSVLWVETSSRTSLDFPHLPAFLLVAEQPRAATHGYHRLVVSLSVECVVTVLHAGPTNTHLCSVHVCAHDVGSVAGGVCGGRRQHLRRVWQGVPRPQPEVPAAAAHPDAHGGAAPRMSLLLLSGQPGGQPQQAHQKPSPERL